MKKKQKKKLRDFAASLAKLEKKYQQDPNKVNEEEIEELISDFLALNAKEDKNILDILFTLDEMIQDKLTK